MGGRLAKFLNGGEVIELSSDLGGGKTTFVQGLAAGLGYTGEVTSPTFMISQIYPLANGLELHHYDLYRLGASGAVGDELAEDLDNPLIITVIEWAALVAGELPADRLTIAFSVTGDQHRDLTFTSGGPVSGRLLKGMQA